MRRHDVSPCINKIHFKTNLKRLQKHVKRHIHAVERHVQSQEHRSRNSNKQQQILVEATDEVPDQASLRGRALGQRKRNGHRVSDRVNLHVDGQAKQERGRRPSPGLQTQQRGQNQNGQQRLCVPTRRHADGQRVQQPQAAANTGRTMGRAAESQQPQNQQPGQKIAGHEEKLPEVSGQQDVGRQDQRQQRRVAERGSAVRTLALHTNRSLTDL